MKSGSYRAKKTTMPPHIVAREHHYVATVSQQAVALIARKGPLDERGGGIGPIRTARLAHGPDCASEAL